MGTSLVSNVDVAYVLDPLIATSNTVNSVVGMLRKVSSRERCRSFGGMLTGMWDGRDEEGGGDDDDDGPTDDSSASADG